MVDLSWSPGDKMLATASVDNTVIVWNAEQFPEILKTITKHQGLVKGVAFDPIGKYLATQSDDKSLRIWRISDWKEESVVKEPFAESGSTTHVLRCNWSPEGSMLVTAHAMNEGGPTAQIIERNGFTTNRDFVGHKKAITCVRFNPNLIQRKKHVGQGVHTWFATVALGSRDRSFSVWSTAMTRPLFVVKDAFEQSVMDLTWSKDGKVLLACSMDGTVAAVVFEDKELGLVIPHEKVRQHMAKVYGKEFKIPTLPLSAKKSEVNGSPLIVENPELLKTLNNKNGEKKKVPLAAVNGNGKTAAAVKPKGPTDKQIEAVTSDGKRRITPIFIPVDDNVNGPIGTGEFGSSSTKEKSSIEIEKRGETSSESSKVSGDSKAAAAAEKPSKVNNNKVTNDAKTKKTDDESDDDAINVIAVRKKPKKILQSDDDEESDDGDGKKGKKEEEESKTGGEIEAKPIEVKRKKDLPKPSLFSAKRKAQDQQQQQQSGDDIRAKKRGRSSAKHESDVIPTSTAMNREIAPKIQLISSRSEFANSCILPPMNAEKTLSFTFSVAEATILAGKVVNEFKKVSGNGRHFLHLLKMTLSRPDSPNNDRIIHVLLPSPVLCVHFCSESVIAATSDGSLHLFTSKGQRRCPPLVLPGPISRLACDGAVLAAVTTNAKFFQWKIQSCKPLIKKIVDNACILSLLQRSGCSPKRDESDDSEQDSDEDAVYVDRLVIITGEKPVLITNAGNTYAYDEDIGTWLRLADNESVVHGLSSYCSEKRNLPESGLRLASITAHSASKNPALVDDVSSTLRMLADVNYCEARKVSAMYLNSAEEVHFWRLAEIRHLAESADADFRSSAEDQSGKSPVNKLRWILDDLMKEDEKMFREALGIVGKQVGLQRLYLEFTDRVKSNHDVHDLDKELLSSRGHEDEQMITTE